MVRNMNAPFLFSSGDILMQKCIPAIVFSICFVWCKSPVQADESRQPHIVVILADDAGWGDFSCVGNKTISTPAVDSLACDGALLEQFFVQPVCAPTRAEFLTGRYHDRSGVRGVTRGEERMSPEEQTVADVFKRPGTLRGVLGNGTMAHSGHTIHWHVGSIPSMGLRKGIGVIISIHPCNTTRSLKRVRDISLMTSLQRQSVFSVIT